MTVATASLTFALTLLMAMSSCPWFRKTSPADVTLTLSGGFMTVVYSAGEVSLVHPHLPGDTHGSVAHAPVLTITDGSYDGPQGPIDLNGFKVEVIVDDGQTAPGVVLANMDPLESPNGDKCATPVQDAARGVSLRHLPDLKDLHPRATLNLANDRLSTRIDLEGGSLKAKLAQRCWALRNSNSGRAIQPMVYGPETLEYASTAINGKVEIHLTPLGQGTSRKIVITPVTPGGAIGLDINYPIRKGAMLAKNQPMPDFARFYSVIEGVQQPDWFIPYAADDPPPHGGPDPGIECGGMTATISARR